jgi:hypothetical protein
VNLAQGQKPLPSNDPMDDVKLVECGFSHHVLRSTTLILMVLLALMILTTVLCSALLAISKRQEMMLETLLRQSGGMQKILARKLHETQCQAGGYRNGERN